MASTSYDRDADKQRSPTSDSPVTSSQTSTGRSSTTSSSPYSHSIQSRRQNPQGTSSTAREGGAVSRTGPNGDGQEATPAEDLASQENEPKQGFSFRSEPSSKQKGGRQKKRKARFSNWARKKAILMLGGGLISIAVVLIGALIGLIPLKIEDIVTNLQNRFFATSENAIQNEGENFMSEYVKKYVLPALTKCSGNSIDKNCNPRIGNGNNPVTNLYKGWSDARFENKLAENYGIEFKYNKSTHKYYMKSPGIANPNGDDITNFSHPDGKDLFQQVSRGEARQAVRGAMADETLWKKVLYRFKVGRLLEEKYGLNRCVIFCGTRDALADKIADQKVAAKLYIVQRVITPRTEVLGVVMECIFDPSCEPEHSSPTTSADTTSTSNGSVGATSTTTGGQATISTGTEEAGVPQDINFDGQVLKDFAASRGSIATAEELEKAYKTVTQDGYQKYLIDTALEKIGLKDLSSQILDTASTIQWVQKVTGYIKILQSIGPKIKKLAYVTNSSGDVKLFGIFRTYADEIHTGKVTATEVGSMTSSLGSVSSSYSTKDLVGGTASAEQTPAYANLIDHSASNVTSTSYECANGKPPGSSLVCSEDKLGGGNKLADSISNFLKQPPFTYIVAISDGINSVLNTVLSPITDIFSSVISNIPFVSGIITDATSFVTKAAEPLMGKLVKDVIPNPFSPNMSGGRTFVLAAAGADVAGNNFAQEGLGGKKVPATQAASVAAAQDQENQHEFSQQPLFARLFSTDSPYSLISKVAMAVPLDIRSSGISFVASIFTSPLHFLSTGFASLLTGKVSAGTLNATGVVNGDDIYGVNQYLPETVATPTDYWDQNCSDNASYAYGKDNSWNEAAAAYDTTSDSDPSGEPVNTTANPCLTIKTSIGVLGATSDTSNLTSDDLADVPSDSTSTTSTATSASGYANPFPGGWVPDRLDMGYDGTFKGQIVAPFDGTITYAGPFKGWQGSMGIIIKADNDVGLPTRSLYFTEGVSPIVSSDTHVTAGTPIANATDSPYGNSYKQGSNGAIEWGVNQDGKVGKQVDTYAIKLGTGTAAAKSMVLSFAQWATQKLGVAPPSDTSNAGSP